jgi:hypothetical protein
MMAGEVRISGDLQPLGDSAFHLDAVVLGIVMARALPPAPGAPQCDLSFPRLLRVGGVHLSEIRSGVRASAAEAGKPAAAAASHKRVIEVVPPHCC